MADDANAALIDRVLKATTRVPVERSGGDDRLPSGHRRLLEQGGHLLAYKGYFRLFGAGGDRGMGLPAWNAPETWKFAWPERVSDYFCFGGTAWGDQYAYRIDQLSGPSEPEVWMLDALTMQPTPIADTFDAFLETEFLRNADTPYDDVLVSVAARLGPLSIDQHVAHSPSVLISGAEDPSTAVILPAVDAMVFNGDLHRQIIEAKRTTDVTGIAVVTDERDRPRLKVA